MNFVLEIFFLFGWTSTFFNFFPLSLSLRVFSFLNRHMSWVYTALLTDGHFHVFTSDVGPEDMAPVYSTPWTDLHPLVRITTCKPCACATDAEGVVSELVAAHGWRKVRGTGFSDTYPDEQDLFSLRQRVDMPAKRCFECGSDDGACDPQRCAQRVRSAISPRRRFVEYSGIGGDEFPCPRCGSDSHVLAGCYAACHTKGGPCSETAPGRNRSGCCERTIVYIHSLFSSFF